MSGITPDDIAQQDFRRTFRGFDPEEVRAFVRVVADGVSGLVAELDRLEQQIAAGGSGLQAEFEQVGREVSSVLEQARQAAESMRERAAAEAARWRSEAMADSESQLRQARTDAEQLRSDAWATAEELLAQSQREASHLVDEARSEALRIIGEAERESHKLTAAARRQSEEAVRLARMEAERLTIDAQARHDEMIEAAARQSETAQERTRALEQRRDELKKELETVRQALASMESAMDERREQLGLTVSGPAPARREERAPEIPGEHWVPGETVRVVRPEPSAAGTETPGSKVQRISETPEIKLISAEELMGLRGKPKAGPGAAPVETPPAPPEQPEEPPVAESTEDHPEPEPPEDRTEAEEPTEEPAPAPVGEPDQPSGVEEPDEAVTGPQPEARQQSFDDLVGLFERLRTEREAARASSPIPQPTTLPTEPAVAAGEAEAGSESIAGQEAQKVVPPSSGPAGDPFAIRDQLLLPVSNRALRNLKRQLAEEGNVVLEELHQNPEGWAPDPEQVQAKVRADLVVLLTESFGAGHAAAERLTDRRLSRPATPKPDVAAEFSADLVSDIVHALAEGRAAGQGALQLKATVARVFRAWRTDESERRMRGLSVRAFNEGLVTTLQMNDVRTMAWVLSGRGCSTCRSLSEQPVTDRIPPAHSGCECMVVPA